MNFWYFKFEGIFSDQEQQEHLRGKGVFSSCLIPTEKLKAARKMFESALQEENIQLISIIEK